ncbi:MAG: DUF2520 domain-containing protein [Bacteroidota bacterium]
MNNAPQINSFVVVGAGRAATQLAIALKNNGFQILQILGRSFESTKILADKIGCPFTIDSKQIRKDADACLISVPDESFVGIVKKLYMPYSIVMHTSGTMPLDSLKNISDSHGVLYPLQTMTLQCISDFSSVPLLIEGSDIETQNKIKSVAEILSDNVIEMNSAKRAVLHVAAVIACNFTNHLFAKSYEWCAQNKIDFSVLMPLIRQTCENATRNNPSTFQTGPAVRGDESVIAEHLHMLEANPELRELYAFLTNSIINDQKKSDEKL